jgi:hypothetical protein
MAGAEAASVAPFLATVAAQPVHFLLARERPAGPGADAPADGDADTAVARAWAARFLSLAKDLHDRSTPVAVGRTLTHNRLHARGGGA